MARYTQRPENALKRANGKCIDEWDFFTRKIPCGGSHQYMYEKVYIMGG